jgi:hypothetical protein
MSGQTISPIVASYKSMRRPGRRWPGKVAILTVVFINCLILFGARGLAAADIASVAASLFTADAILVALWQWRAQRREVSLEAYFARLNVPNERRLAYYQQAFALSDVVGKQALANALEQYYIFYVYAELDNLEYAMTKYADGSMSAELAERAVETFVSRCQQSNDFRKLARIAVTDSGYTTSFEAFVRELAERGIVEGQPDEQQQLPHPMQHDELEIVRQLRKGSV